MKRALLVVIVVMATLLVGTTAEAKAPRGPCRGLSPRQTIICAERIWPVPGSAAMALYIADRESSLLPHVISPSGTYYGLFQIGKYHMPDWPNNMMQGDWWERWFPHLAGHRSDPNMLLNARFNAFLAIRVAHDGGWGPWGH